MEDNHKYDDIIELDRPVSGRAHMTLEERAAQFSSFAALTGYNDVINESARYTEDRIELDDDKRELLDRLLSDIINIPYGERKPVTVTFYVPDSNKAGGSYEKLTDIIKHIDINNKCIVMSDGEIIEAERIVSIDYGDS